LRQRHPRGGGKGASVILILSDNRKNSGIPGAFVTQLDFDDHEIFGSQGQAQVIR
jgi:hypothetical protein